MWMFIIGMFICFFILAILFVIILCIMALVCQFIACSCFQTDFMAYVFYKLNTFNNPNAFPRNIKTFKCKKGQLL